MALAFSYNGVDLGGTTYGLTLAKTENVLGPASKINMVDVAFRPGAYTFDRFAQVRSFSLNCAVEGTSSSNLMTKLDSIALILNEARPKQLIFDFQTDRYYMAQLGEGGIERVHVGALAAKISIPFVCADPHAYSTTLTTQTEVPFTSGSAFDIPDGGGVVAGSAIIEPVIYVKPADAGGTITAAITLAMSPQGKTATQTLDFVCGADKWFRLHSGLKRWQTATGGSGATPPTSGWTDAMSGFSGEFPLLTPGVENLLTITTGTSGGAGNARNVAVIVYRARYL